MSSLDRGVRVRRSVQGCRQRQDRGRYKAGTHAQNLHTVEIAIAFQSKSAPA
jgi:hypothetical protein